MHLRLFDAESGALEKDFFLSKTWIPAMSDAAIDLETGRLALTSYEIDFSHFTTRPYLRTFSYDL